MKLGISNGWHPHKPNKAADQIVYVSRQQGKRWLKAYKRWRAVRKEIVGEFGPQSVKQQRTYTLIERLLGDEVYEIGRYAGEVIYRLPEALLVDIVRELEK